MSFSIMAISSANAQCVPDPQYTTPGIYPDSATGFSSGCVGVQYDQLITNVVPADTCVVIIPGFPCADVPIDSIKIISFTGLPAGFSYSCNDPGNTTSPPDQCTYEGGTIGCAAITGMPTVGDIGIHNLVITVDVYAGGLSSSQGTQVIDWYFIEIVDASSCASGLVETTSSNVRVYPNPTESVLTLDGLNPATENITVTNMHGQLIHAISVVNSLSMEIDVEHLENGIYFIHINSTDGSEVHRFIKK